MGHLVPGSEGAGAAGGKLSFGRVDGLKVLAVTRKSENWLPQRVKGGELQGCRETGLKVSRKGKAIKGIAPGYDSVSVDCLRAVTIGYAHFFITFLKRVHVF